MRLKGLIKEITWEKDGVTYSRMIVSTPFKNVPIKICFDEDIMIPKELVTDEKFVGSLEIKR